MTITAKYASICPCCNVAIIPGTPVEWSKGSKARHVTCGARTASPAPSVAARTSRPYRGKWTGCSCGSREIDGDLVPSDRNCSSCEHDA